MNAGITTAPSLVLACVFYANDTSVGIVSVYLYSGFVRTSSAIGRRSSTLSFCINRSFRGGRRITGQKICLDRKPTLPLAAILVVHSFHSFT